jgi:outer membrane biosynthesis protein TonB
MFDQLLESKAEKQKRFGGGLISVVVHVALIALAVVATGTASVVLEKPKAEEVEFVEVKQDEPPPPEPEEAPPPPDVVAAPPPPKGFQTIVAPVEIPDVIPDIDLTKAVTNEDDFSGRGVEGGIAKGVVGGTGPVVTDQPFFEFQVEKPAIASQGNPPPRYPEILRGAGVEGETLVQFVVDTTGRGRAAALGLADRGLLAEGQAADVVLFDPATIIDRSTYDDPHQYPAAIGR